MVCYYQLFNMNVPKAIWSGLIKKHQLNTMSNLIQADMDKANELKSFIDCIFDLLERGYILNKNFQFITANIEE